MAKTSPKGKTLPVGPRIKASSPLSPSSLPPSSPALSSIDPSNALTELLVAGLRELYWAENHLVLNLPKIQAAAGNTTLSKAVAQHWKITKGHVARLEKAFTLLGVPFMARKCDGMEGLVMEGEGIVDSTKPGSPSRTAGLIMGCRKVETYEITAYKGLSLLATKLGLTEVAKLLEATRAEEEESDLILSELANKQS